ncbi:amidotransferase [Stachybotrys elegans]|uniref:Amidotransferase n=1 Tax=Stachybotrys elegans TaxID=80388 RepID=A0A8K0SGK0_9HYPO|nr:amidotransferase [Stachybotrys elegans]
MSRQMAPPTLLYPEPIAAPVLPTQLKRKDNPRLYGWWLVVVAYLIENLPFLRQFLWHNAGFGVLRDCDFLRLVEPRFDPTVIPQTHATDKSDDSDLPSCHYSASHYRSRYLSGELSPLDLVRSVLPLIRRDMSPPGEHSTAWIDVKPDIVIRSAQESTARYKKGQSLGPLDGVLVAVKDSYDMQGYSTTHGSALDLTGRDENGHAHDSWCVQKLKEAGCIILGKLNMHELGMDTSGVNVTYGTPRNPFHPRYYTGGSSSGSAYAVASGLVPIALGTDGGGSIRIPASFCSVFGLKPTHGRLSYHPGHNHASTSEVNGIIASDIQSLVSAYRVVGQPHPTSGFPPIALGLDRSKILGIDDDWLQQSTPEVQAIYRSLIKDLQRKGYSTVSVKIPFVAEGQIAHTLSILNDAGTGIGKHTHLISAPNRIFAAMGRATPATDYLLAQKLRRVLMQHLSYLWKQHPDMILITPTTACAGWPMHSESELVYGINDGNRTLQTMEYVWLANFCGVPSLSVPAGYALPSQIAGKEGKVPVGVMAMAEWGREDILLGFGLDVQVLGGERQVRPPNWVDTISLTRK